MSKRQINPRVAAFLEANKDNLEEAKKLKARLEELFSTFDVQFDELPEDDLPTWYNEEETDYEGDLEETRYAIQEAAETFGRGFNGEEGYLWTPSTTSC